MSTLTVNGILLQFSDSWEKLETADVEFGKALKQSGGEVGSIEYFRDVDNMRRGIVMHRADGAPDTQALERMEQYLAQLGALLSQAPDVSFKWNSPLSSHPSSLHKLQGLAQELAMATFLYGSGLRAAALFHAGQEGADSRSGSTAPAPSQADAAPASLPHSSSSRLADAATCLRRAAGVFTWLADKHLPALQHALSSDRPLELLPGLSTVMAQTCVAEAQAVTAHRAGQRGTSAATTASLHVGASEAFDQAARTLKDLAKQPPSGGVSDRLKRFLGVAATLERARAFRQLACDLAGPQGQAGQGEAACVEAAGLLQACVPVTEVDPAWRALVVADLASVEEVRRNCERDRKGVYFQTVSARAPALPAGRMLIVPIEYSPTSATLPPGAAA